MAEPRAANAVLTMMPGVLVCLALGAAAQGLGALEALLFGRAWIEPLVLAILLGTVVGNAIGTKPWLAPGVRLSAKTLLDIAVALLGASLSIQSLETLGLAAFLIIVAFVFVSLGVIFMIGRLLGLGRRLAMLIAVGNSICGNSAIAAAAPIIGATEDEIAASISLTALLGVIAVLVLPTAVYVFGMSVHRYALFSGLAVYAVPQVIAAAAPFGTGAVTLATFVKLARVLLLGPLTLFLSLLAPHFERSAEASGRGSGTGRLLLPWFIIAFLALAVLRWTGVLPPPVISACSIASTFLAIVAMAGLGLGVRLASVAEVGVKVGIASAAASIFVVALSALAATRL